jgi:hypothetical protein
MSVSDCAKQNTLFDLLLDMEILLIFLKKKAKLELITGIPISSQSLTLHDSVDDKNGPGVSLNEDDERMLGAYGIRDWMLIKVGFTYLIGVFSSLILIEVIVLRRER